MKISKIEETPIKPYFSDIAMNKLEWKARIDDTDVAKQESKVDKKEKRKVQRKSRTKKKSERRAHPGQKKRQHQRECNALIRDYGNILMLPDVRSPVQGKSPAKDSAIPAWEKFKPAGFSTLTPKK